MQWVKTSSCYQSGDYRIYRRAHKRGAVSNRPYLTVTWHVYHGLTPLTPTDPAEAPHRLRDAKAIAEAHAESVKNLQKAT